MSWNFTCGADGGGKVLNAGESFIRNNRLGYTAAMGVDPLRQRISKFYRERYSTSVRSLYWYGVSYLSCTFLTLVKCDSLGRWPPMMSLSPPVARAPSSYPSWLHLTRGNACLPFLLMYNAYQPNSEVKWLTYTCDAAHHGPAVILYALPQLATLAIGIF